MPVVRRPAWAKCWASGARISCQDEYSLLVRDLEQELQPAAEWVLGPEDLVEIDRITGA
jgi:hypothetical protein